MHSHCCDNQQISYFQLAVPFIVSWDASVNALWYIGHFANYTNWKNWPSQLIYVIRKLCIVKKCWRWSWVHYITVWTKVRAGNKSEVGEKWAAQFMSELHWLRLDCYKCSLLSFLEFREKDSIVLWRCRTFSGWCRAGPVHLSLPEREYDFDSIESGTSPQESCDWIVWLCYRLEGFDLQSLGISL